MKDASNALMTVEEVTAAYCKAILDADSVEEVSEIRESVANTFKECGFDDEYIANLNNTVDRQLVAIETGLLVFNEKGQLVTPGEYAEQITTQEPSANIQREAEAKAAAGFSLAAAAIVASLALKKAVLKHQKSKTK